jgi:NTE family protein
MAITIEGKEKRIGLALSGGGFRAAAFHLGVFRKLQTLGLLDKLDLLSCVSGGSIAGGFLAAEWGTPDVLERLETYLRTKSVAVSSVLGGAIDPFHSRLDKLASTYARDLFGERRLGDLAGGPRIYLNTTNLATGNLFFFVAGGGADAELGEHELGVVKAPTFPLSRVYDHMGVNPLLRARNDLDYMIVSDGGRPFSMVSEPTESGALVLRASIDIMMEQIRGLEFDRMEHRHRAGVGPRPLWFSIDSTEGELQAGDATFAARVGTNLAKLSPLEMTVLTRHAGALLETRLRRYAPELTPQSPPH